MTLTWNCPPYDGGSPVTGYLVEYKTSISDTWIEHDRGNEKSIVLAGLAENTNYTVRVFALNVLGKGPASECCGFKTSQLTDGVFPFSLSW